MMSSDGYRWRKARGGSIENSEGGVGGKRIREGGV
jgi:hypothetical protein